MSFNRISLESLQHSWAVERYQDLKQTHPIPTEPLARRQPPMGDPETARLRAASVKWFRAPAEPVGTWMRCEAFYERWNTGLMATVMAPLNTVLNTALPELVTRVRDWLKACRIDVVFSQVSADQVQFSVLGQAHPLPYAIYFAPSSHYGKLRFYVRRCFTFESGRGPLLWDDALQHAQGEFTNDTEALYQALLYAVLTAVGIREPVVKTRLIAGWPGVGKSYLGQAMHEASSSAKFLDLDSTPFNHRTNGQEDTPVFDAMTGARLVGPYFVPFYASTIERLLRTERYTIIYCSTHRAVLEALLARLPDTQLTLVIPAAHLKEEYLQRYRDRGSPQGMIGAMDQLWDQFQSDARELTSLHPERIELIELQAGQYLSDVIATDVE